MNSALRHAKGLSSCPSQARRHDLLPERPQRLAGRPRAPVTAAAEKANAAEQLKQQKAKKAADPMQAYRPPSREGASLRAEAEAPFRAVRLFLFGGGLAGASLATLFGLPALIAALGDAPGATKSVAVALQDCAINIGCVTAFAFLVKRDIDAREKQMARLLREDELGACQLELANRKVLRLGQLRGFARCVLVAGTTSQVAAALAAAEPYKQALSERGVLVVPLPFVPDPSSSSSGGDAAAAEAAAASLAAPGKEDLRWRATPIRMDDWRRWFEQQAGMAGKTLDAGLYISLRLDGRVRGSGLGAPNWAAMAAQLPPTEGVFGGFLDGMDGRISSFD